MTARDIYGNPTTWEPTGRRLVAADGRLRAEMRRGEYVVWMACRPHEDCAACAEPRDHDRCPEVRP